MLGDKQCIGRNNPPSRYKLFLLDYQMELKIVIPEMPEISKNDKYFGRGKIIKPEFRSAVEAIFYKVKITKNKNNVKFIDKKKVTIDFLHYRKKHNSDAHNFIEGICDAIKDAIEVDDRYYKVISDYEIDKENPRFEITITQ